MFSNLPNLVALDIILFQRIVELIWSMYMSGGWQEHGWKLRTGQGKNNCFDGSRALLDVYIAKHNRLPSARGECMIFLNYDSH